jgi:hypothetical protein
MDTEYLRDSLSESIAEQLRGTWHCRRVWEAWNVGTMGRDDFSPVDESDTPYEVADSVLASPIIATALNIVERLAALSDGLSNSNSSAEEIASRLAGQAVKLIAAAQGGKSDG